MPLEGTCKIEYEPATDYWKAYGFENGSWNLISTCAYRTCQGAKLDMWYRYAINHFKDRINGKHRTAAQASHGYTTGESVNTSGGTLNSPSTSGALTVLSASGGSSGPSTITVPIAGAAISVTGTVVSSTGLTQYFPHQNPGQQWTQIFGGGNGGGIHQINPLQQGQWIVATSVPTFPPPEVEIQKGDTKFGEIVAWRAWRSGPQGLLMSMAMDTLWIPGEPMKGDPTTDAGGVYAWKTRDAALAYAHYPWRIFGEIYLYGTVDEYEHGYRAEYGSIKSIEVVDDMAQYNMAKPDVDEMVEKLRTRYLKTATKETQ